MLETQETSPPARPAPALVPAISRTVGGPPPGFGRPRVDGKFLAVGEERLWVRGVTYGTFAPGDDGERFPAAEQVADDFAAMVLAGINAVRVYTPPPCWLLDAASTAGLWVMAGLPWEQHVAFLEDRGRARSILGRVGAAVAATAGHPALLAYSVGNEIPASVVRWHGRRRIERFLDRLCGAVRAADPGALVTYVNFPSTEYLRVPAADVMSFNVYLEDRAAADESGTAYGAERLRELDALCDGRVRAAIEQGDVRLCTFREALA